MPRPCLGALALAVCLSVAAAPARADDTAPAQESTFDRHPSEATLYLWMPMVASQINSDHGQVKSYISFSDLLSNLNGGLMLHGRYQVNESWSVVGDLFWAHLRADNQTKQVKFGPRGDIVLDAQLKAALGLWIVELNGGYKLFRFGSLFSRNDSDPRHTVGEMYFGGRYYSVNPDIQAQAKLSTPLGNRRFDTSIGQNQAWVDPVVGLRFGADLSRTTRLTVMGDVGGFNLADGYSSEFSWSQTTAISWDFADNWRFHMGYRFLEFKRDFDPGKIHVQLRGPFLAVGYTF